MNFRAQTDGGNSLESGHVIPGGKPETPMAGAPEPLLSALVLISCCLSAKIPHARHTVCQLSALPLDSADQSITNQRAHKTIE
jgi:hypothetical protein